MFLAIRNTTELSCTCRAICTIIWRAIFVVCGYYLRLTSLGSWTHTCRFGDLQNRILAEQDVTGWLERLAPTKAVRLRFQAVHVWIMLDEAVTGQDSLSVLRLSHSNEGYRSHWMPSVTIRHCYITIHPSPIAWVLRKRKGRGCFRISYGDVMQWNSFIHNVCI
jgi:hypothetical protein